jgi:predicted AAA+ superfamily ATPase
MIQWDVDVIYVLRGPRQVGKTTLIKLKIRDLLQGGTPPRSIFYWACDLVEKPSALVDIVDSYLNFSQSSKTRSYIFLDEISSVKDWQKGVKALYDAGRLKNVTLMLTGSHSIDLERASESLAGRRGETGKLRDKLPDKLLLPAKFSEYAETRSKDIEQLINSHLLFAGDWRRSIIAKISEGKIPDELDEANLHLNELNRLFDDYLITGGVPRPINSYVTHGSISSDVYDSYVQLLLKDITNWGGKESFMRQIVRKVTETQALPVSLRTLMEDTEITSHNTVSTYLDYLADSFVLSQVYKLDLARNLPVLNGNRKLHFRDPFIFHALRAWSLQEDPFEGSLKYLQREENKGALVESVVAEHLIRLLFGFLPSAKFDYTTSLFYSVSKKKRELDFAVRISDKYLPVEVKYQSQIRKEDGYGMIDFQKGGRSLRGIMLTKDSLAEQRSYVQIPVPLFLLFV